MMRTRRAFPDSIPTHHRRGAVLLWFIVALPVLLTLLCVLLEVANLYLARAELTNALEAAALAAVKDWGDNDGGDTLRPRRVGNAYAAANTINGVPVDLQNIDPTLNYFGFGTRCNQNTSGQGVLVFGAIIEDTPDFVFDCCATPSCLAGRVVFDVTAQGSLQTGSNNEWGISFQPTSNIPSDVRIRRVIYTLPDTCEYFDPPNSNNLEVIQPRFDFRSENSIPMLSIAVSDCHPNNLLTDNCPSGNNVGTSSQADVYGIDRTSVDFYVNVTDPCELGNGDLVEPGMPAADLSRTMAVEFPDVPNNDLLGFDLEERIRFGASVTDNGSGTVGADQIGLCGVEVTVCFNDGTFVTGTFVNNNEPSNQCLQCVDVAPWGMNTPLSQIPCNNQSDTAGNHGLIIHPNGTPDIPCPAASGQNNNGQSLAFVGAEGSGRAFAVRAQATFPVQSICSRICGIEIGPFFVTAKADALYDCALRTPRLYHLKPENYFCPCPICP